MFTGIITDVGRVRRLAGKPDGGLALEIATAFTALVPGESIAVDGACLTVEEVGGGGFTVSLVPTTVERTGFGGYAEGRRVNLERALQVGERLGGHIVQGHVDGLARVIRSGEEAGRWLMDLEVPEAVARISIPLGSITVDGVSLTVNAKPAPRAIQVSLVPFTLQHTTLGERKPGDRVHVEGDVLGKYVEGLLQARTGA